MLAISTAWNHKSNVGVETMLTEIKALGLDAIELGYKLTAEELEGVRNLLGKMAIKVLSIHNFCPLPNDGPCTRTDTSCSVQGGPSLRHPSNYYRLSAVDEKERRRAVEWTEKTVDTAERVGAKVVVIHGGTIEGKSDPTAILKKYKMGQGDSKELDRSREEISSERRRNQAPFWRALIQSLDDVIPYARQRKVEIGLETRYYPNEIPDFEEIGVLLDRYPRGLGYWHDVGHAEVNCRLGLVKAHRDYFDRYGGRLLGMHIHGVKGLQDHLAPFKGDFDLKTVMPYLKDGLIKVIESHGGATAEEIKEAVRRLR